MSMKNQMTPDGIEPVTYQFQNYQADKKLQKIQTVQGLKN